METTDKLLLCMKSVYALVVNKLLNSSEKKLNKVNKIPKKMCN